ncbi:calmodulin-like 38, partial [Prunus dulcis]
SSTLLDSPSLLSILLRLLGVMHPNPHPQSITYILNASFKSFTFSSSLLPSTNLTKSSKPSSPSLCSTATSASVNESSPPIAPTHCCSSEEVIKGISETCFC